MKKTILILLITEDKLIGGIKKKYKDFELIYKNIDPKLMGIGKVAFGQIKHSTYKDNDTIPDEEIEKIIKTINNSEFTVYFLLRHASATHAKCYSNTCNLFNLNKKYTNCCNNLWDTPIFRTNVIYFHHINDKHKSIYDFLTDNSIIN